MFTWNDEQPGFIFFFLFFSFFFFWRSESFVRYLGILFFSPSDDEAKTQPKLCCWKTAALPSPRALPAYGSQSHPASSARPLLNWSERDDWQGNTALLMCKNNASILMNQEFPLAPGRSFTGEVKRYLHEITQAAEANNPFPSAAAAPCLARGFFKAFANHKCLHKHRFWNCGTAVMLVWL